MNRQPHGAVPRRVQTEVGFESAGKLGLWVLAQEERGKERVSVKLAITYADIPPKNSNRKTKTILELLHDLRPSPVHPTEENKTQPTQQPDWDDLFHHVVSFLMTG